MLPRRVANIRNPLSQIAEAAGIAEDTTWGQVKALYSE